MNCLFTVGHDSKITHAGDNDHAEDFEYDNVEAWDDVSGGILDAKKVRQARLEELKYIEDKQVWEIVDRTYAEQRGIKIIKTRWIDVNKGDSEKEKYRSRLVAKEFNISKEDGIFASTPPLEALRWLISEAATTNKNSKTGMKGENKVMLLADVARAFFLKRQCSVS